MNNNPDEILIFGGGFTPINETVKLFNVKTKTWKVNHNGIHFFKKLNVTKAGGHLFKHGPIRTTLTFNDLNLNQLILFGGGYADGREEESDFEGYSRLIIYNIKNNKCKTIGKNKNCLIGDHNSLIHDVSLMVFRGGSIIYSMFIKFDTIICFNIEDEK